MKLKLLVMATLFSSFTACGDSGNLFGPDRAPVISSLDYNPKTSINKSKTVTFSMVAHDPDGKPLQYNWSASDGTLTGDSGSTVRWKPIRDEGEGLEQGTYSVSVIVSDGKMTNTASVNILVDENENIKVTDEDKKDESNNTQDSVINSQINEVVINNYNIPEITTILDNQQIEDGNNDIDSKNNEQIIFSEYFSDSYLDEKWNVSYSDSQDKNYLTWKSYEKGLNEKTAIILTGPTDQILPKTNNHSEVRLTSKIIDLKKYKNPRLKLFAKSMSNPSSSVNLKIYWSNDGKDFKPLNLSFIPDKDWKKIDIDLNNISEFQNYKEGFLTIGTSVKGNINSFSGVIIDDLVIYETKNI